MKNLLFITWDGPQTSYMEGLFMPIFQKISESENIQFHVMQFTWADENRTASIQKAAEKMGIHYTAEKMYRKPMASIGSLLTIQSGTKKIKKYIQEHEIDVVMPRSTFPAMMVNALKNGDLKVIFDADGLPIEERVDFSGLKQSSLMYKWMKAAETKMLKNADAVITRSQKAIDIHIQNIGEVYRNKFSVVYNGRNAQSFTVNSTWRNEARKELQLQNELLFVYAGSLGPQYCVTEMLAIFNEYKKQQTARFLILTGNIEYAHAHIPEHLKNDIIIKSVASHKVPYYLSAADIAFGLRTPSFSMQGVAPIKLGEYLLCGLPTIASKGIGDSESILQQFEDCYLYDHHILLDNHLNNILLFIKKVKFATKEEIRFKALNYFSLEAAAISYNEALEKIL